MWIRTAVLVSVALSAVSAAAETAAVRMVLQVLLADPVSALALDREARLHKTFEDVHICCLSPLIDVFVSVLNSGKVLKASKVRTFCGIIS